MIETIAKIAAEVGKEGIKSASKLKETMAGLDKPLTNTEVFKKIEVRVSPNGISMTKRLDAPLNFAGNVENKASVMKEGKIVEKVERMEPQVVIKFKCPEGMDRKEFIKQLKGQERGLNRQSVAENMKNRAAFEQRKAETGNGRDLEAGKKAQDIAREKATQSRIESNQKKGMTYGEAKREAEGWIKTQDALHNPDQIAGGDPSKVSRMGDASVNRSIGSQWNSRVGQLADAVEAYAKEKGSAELANVKMNVKLVVV